MSRFFLCFFVLGLVCSTDVLAFGGSRQSKSDRGFYGVNSIGVYYGGQNPAEVSFQSCSDGEYLRDGVCYNPCDEVLISYPDSDCQSKKSVNNACEITPVQDGTPCGRDTNLINAACYNGFCVESAVDSDDDMPPEPVGDDDDDDTPPVPAVDDDDDDTPPGPATDDDDDEQTCNVTDYKQCSGNQILNEETHCCVDCPEGLTRAEDLNMCVCNQQKYDCADNQIFDEGTRCCVDCPEGLKRYKPSKNDDGWEWNVCTCRSNADCQMGEFCHTDVNWDDNDACYDNVDGSKCESNNEMQPGSSMSGFILSQNFELTHRAAENWCASHNKRLFTLAEFECYRHRSNQAACLYEEYGSCGMDNPNSNSTTDNWNGGIGSGCCCSGTQSCSCGHYYDSITENLSTYSEVAVQLYNQFGYFHTWTRTLHDNYRCGYFYFGIDPSGSDIHYSTGAGNSHNALCR